MYSFGHVYVTPGVGVGSGFVGSGWSGSGSVGSGSVGSGSVGFLQLSLNVIVYS